MPVAFAGQLAPSCSRRVPSFQRVCILCNSRTVSQTDIAGNTAALSLSLSQWAMALVSASQPAFLMWQRHPSTFRHASRSRPHGCSCHDCNWSSRVLPHPLQLARRRHSHIDTSPFAIQRTQRACTMRGRHSLRTSGTLCVERDACKSLKVLL